MHFTSTFRSGVAGSALDSSIRAVLQDTVKFIAASGLIGQSAGGRIGKANTLEIQRAYLPRARTLDRDWLLIHKICNRNVPYFPLGPPTPGTGGLSRGKVTGAQSFVFAVLFRFIPVLQHEPRLGRHKRQHRTDTEHSTTTIRCNRQNLHSFYCCRP